jgi:hypothetical protein
MPSPFPGMDPYLEAPDGWGGVHLALLYQLHAELNRVLPDGVVARMDEYVWIRDSDDDAEMRVKPDVFVPQVRGGPNGHTALLAPPVTEPTTRGELPRSRKKKNRVVTITTARGHNVLTVIEVLSPSSKGTGDDRAAYVHKRRGYLASVNLIEVDLLRAGNRLPMGHPTPPVSDYYVFSCRRDEYPGTATWAFSVRDPLPTIPVPLSPEFGVVPLNLQSAFTRAYEEGRYDKGTNYTVPPTPPLRPTDAEWAAELLAKNAKKKKR